MVGQQQRGRVKGKRRIRVAAAKRQVWKMLQPAISIRKGGTDWGLPNALPERIRPIIPRDAQFPLNY